MNVGPNVDFEQETPRSDIPQPERDRASGPKRRASQNRSSGARERGGAPKPGFSLDLGSLIVPAAKRWPWLILGAIVGTALGAYLGLGAFKQSYSATAKLERYVPPLATDAYKPEPMTVPTLVHLIMSPDFFLKIGRKLNPPQTGAAVAGSLKTVPERNTEILSVQAGGQSPAAAVGLANLYTAEVVQYTKDIQRREAAAAEMHTIESLKDIDNDIAQAKKDIPPLPPGALARLTDITAALPAGSAPDRFTQKIQIAEDELSVLLSKYTDNWPQVKQKRAEIEALQLQAGAARRLAAADPATTADPTKGVSLEEREVAHFRLRNLESFRQQLNNRKYATERFKADPPGNFRVEMPAALDNVETHRAWPKIFLTTIFFGMLGLTGTAALILSREFFDNRLKTDVDVARVTGLPVIATLGDLKNMSLSARENWAFRTWISLQDRLAFSPNHGLICGITSSQPGEGRSTWVNLLAGAARQCGFRVLTIATKPTSIPAEPGPSAKGTDATDSPLHPAALLVPPKDKGKGKGGFSSDNESTALTASALFTPAEVSEKLMRPESDPVVHIPLPGWTWNLERRKQWQGALNVWRKIDNVVILVELPPASVHESVLLAANLPNILWLSEANKSEATDTRQQLETLRHARCNLVGAVVNRSPAPTKHGRFSRWVGCLLPFVVALGLAGQNLEAQEPRPAALAPDAPSGSSVATFTVTGPNHRAPWQQRFTLGPGDLLTISLFGDASYIREEVPIGPDGKIGYLEAQAIPAAGLTVDELREKLNGELSRFHRSPQVIVLPVAYKSKKYYVLGKVAERGVFILDRPITLIEAIARARGIETGIATADRSLVELADLQRAFVSRRGQHLAVNFHKLFNEGDLSQNVAIEPEDYIYLPSADLKEVYVLGSVRSPGAFLYTTDVGAVAAIAAKGGFTNRAWKGKVLVIRGSLGRPETFIVDAADVLAARAPDITLRPRDIIYVSDRPWARAEELLDTAASAFVTAATVSWTGLHVNGLRQ